MGTVPVVRRRGAAGQGRWHSRQAITRGTRMHGNRPEPPFGISQQNRGPAPSRLLSTSPPPHEPGPGTVTPTGTRTNRPQRFKQPGAGAGCRPPTPAGSEAAVSPRGHSGQQPRACPLTMMASACLGSSSETALRKPLACGVVALGVGMTPATSGAPLRSPLPGGLLKAGLTSQPLRVPHLPPASSVSRLLLPEGGRRQTQEEGLCPIKSNCHRGAGAQAGTATPLAPAESGGARCRVGTAGEPSAPHGVTGGDLGAQKP